jgi:hypothetical protein
MRASTSTETRLRRTPVAKRPEVNKSALIREAVAAHKDKTPTEIAAMLNQSHGLKISGQYVSTIKSNALKKRRAGRRGGKKGVGQIGGNGFTAALEFIKASGGIEAAKTTLGTLEEIGKAL